MTVEATVTLGPRGCDVTYTQTQSSSIKMHAKKIQKPTGNRKTFRLSNILSFSMALIIHGQVGILLLHSTYLFLFSN